ncbi:Gamma-soluble NSF attachment protein [Cryptotermes secundus]|uniref:Gamma-soluble NSF attachment protein n=1 Tax=Cryptotermes secundus TaxID=105785 RepID=A0A2J7PL85_9NEOP|nr:gamma-soluble NSF attachment protein [Cryptotermes secundus]PNF17069.1 Gamma-soluble NSF attachment protein [Cryptotermes secundus]
MALNKKIEEGLDHIKTAEKSLKTSLLKWRPDFDIAADEYSKAATCFRNAKSFEQCKDCLLKAADCHRQNRSLFHAAKCIDQAVLVCKDLGDYRDVASLAERACNLYQQHGSPDSGSASLDKAAKLLESQRPDQALRLYQRAADVVLIEDSQRQGAEFTSKIARLMVKLQMYDEAADALRREIGLHQQSENISAIGRLAVALVLVQLARGDTVAAEKAFKEWGNCCDAPEVQTLEMLLQAFDEEDPQAARQALNNPFIKHMDVEYARLARDLPLPEGVVPVSKPSVRQNAAPSYVSPKAVSAATSAEEGRKSATGESNETKSLHSDDEYEGGLC